MQTRVDRVQPSHHVEHDFVSPLCEAVPSNAARLMDHFGNNEIYCYPLSKKWCGPPLRPPRITWLGEIVTSGRQQHVPFLCLHCGITWASSHFLSVVPFQNTSSTIVLQRFLRDGDRKPITWKNLGTLITFLWSVLLHCHYWSQICGPLSTK